MIMYIKCFLMY